MNSTKDLSNVRFTKLEMANSHVQNELNAFVQVVLGSPCADQVCSIIIEGSFGRGEGGVIEEEGSFISINDYDFLLVVQNRIEQTEIEKIKEAFHRMSTVWRVDIAQYAVSELSKLKPTLKNFDLKYGSRIMYRKKSVLEVIPDWNPNNIFIREAEKLLYTRAISFILTLKNGRAPLNEELDFNDVQQLSKAVIAAYDSWLIERGEYNCSYETRKNKLLLESKFSEEEKRTISWIYDFKLLPSKRYGLPNTEFYRFCLKTYLSMFDHLNKNMYGYRYWGIKQYHIACLLSVRKWLIVSVQKLMRNDSSYYKSLMLSLSQYFLLINIYMGLDTELVKAIKFYKLGFKLNNKNKNDLISAIINSRM